jgi:hypothetical protein
MRRRLAAALLVAAAAAGCSTGTLVLEVGDCFDDPPSLGSVTSVDVIDCAEPHDNEVYFVGPYPGTGEFPGDEAIRDAAVDACLESFEDFVGIPYEVSRFDVFALWPSEESWEATDRDIVCAVYDVDGEKLTGSVRGAAE